MKNRRLFAFALILVMITPFVFAQGAPEIIPEKINLLILPKFEVGEIAGDFPGEAQLYYENYLAGGEEYEIPGGTPGSKLYVKDGIALYITGMGKVNASNAVTAILLDPRFDFSDAYFLSTGCCGSATDVTTMGDVFIISAVADFDLGHHADTRDMRSSDENTLTWFHDEGYDDAAYKALDQDLVNRAYNLVKDVKVDTTPVTRAFMAYTFEDADWATRDPKVLKGTGITGDNYWKGIYDQANARNMVEVYGAPDPFCCSEMEDVGIARTLDRFGMLDRYLIVRDSVNMVVFMNGATPETLWGGEVNDSLASEESIESADIFFTARQNNFKVGSVIVDAIMNDQL